MNTQPNHGFDGDAALRAARPHLVRLCAHLSGDHDIAEDLAQEALLIAWRSRAALRNPDAYHAWLHGIARNVYLRWQRQHVRDQQRHAPPPHPFTRTDPTQSITADVDLDMELERDELATLLDRALALLPPDTRDVLIQTYIHESPHAEIAQRLGVSTNAVGVRVHRGKLALRRILVNKFPDEAAAYGLIDPQGDGWQETRIWCPRCGMRRLSGQFDHAGGMFALRCFGCLPGIDVEICNIHAPAVLHGVKGFKAAWSRTVNWASPFLRQALAAYALCPICKQPTTAKPVNVEVPPFGRVYGLHVQCACDAGAFNSIHALALDQPPVRRFMRDHPRTTGLPTRMLDVGGHEALLTRFENLAGTAHLDLIFARDTYELLSVERGGNG